MAGAVLVIVDLFVPVVGAVVVVPGPPDGPAPIVSRSYARHSKEV
jgi:hypothetical protein